MITLFEKIDDKLENASYLLSYGHRIIKSERDFRIVLERYFSKWQKVFLRMEEKGDWFHKIKMYQEFIKPKDSIETTALAIDEELSKAALNLTGDALAVQQFAEEIMSEWNEYIREDLKGLSKQIDGAMLSNFNQAGMDFVNKFYSNPDNLKFNLTDRKIKESLFSRTQWLTDKVANIEWSRITGKTAQWFYFKGQTPAQLRKWISSTEGYVRTYKGRSMAIARTEVAWAQNQATRIQMYKSGVPYKKFVTEPRDIWPCPECEMNEDAGTIPVEEEFPNGSVPVHPRCACAEIPVVPKDWSPVDEWYGDKSGTPVVLHNPDGSFVRK